MFARLALVGGLSAGLVAPTVARADSSTSVLVERAKAHHRAGQSLFAAGDYRGALTEFEAGYAIAPRVEFLLNIGQAHRQLHETKEAISAFERFLVSVPETDPRRDAVKSVLTELEAEKQPEPAPVVPQPTPPPPVVVVEKPVTHKHRPWYKDPVGDTLTIVGIIGIGAGAGLFAQANNVIGDAGVNLSHFDDAQDAKPRRTAGLVVLGIGGALVVGGVLSYTLRK